MAAWTRSKASAAGAVVQERCLHAPYRTHAGHHFVPQAWPTNQMVPSRAAGPLRQVHMPKRAACLQHAAADWLPLIRECRVARRSVSKRAWHLELSAVASVGRPSEREAGGRQGHTSQLAVAGVAAISTPPCRACSGVCTSKALSGQASSPPVRRVYPTRALQERPRSSRAGRAAGA